VLRSGRARSTRTARHRASSTSIGRAAERAVADFLVARGFAIVALNLRIGHYELDVVARQGPLIVVVEVRTRASGSLTSGFGSLLASKRLRVRRAGERLWQRRYRSDPSAERLRFDAANVSFLGNVPHVEYAPAAF
jgi:putative endonuclease